MLRSPVVEDRLHVRSFTASTLAPAFSSSRAISMCPLTAAQWRPVYPISSCAPTLAPLAARGVSTGVSGAEQQAAGHVGQEGGLWNGRWSAAAGRRTQSAAHCGDVLSRRGLRQLNEGSIGLHGELLPDSVHVVAARWGSIRRLCCDGANEQHCRDNRAVPRRRQRVQHPGRRRPSGPPRRGAGAGAVLGRPR
jgi:hypothetical protein